MYRSINNNKNGCILSDNLYTFSVFMKFHEEIMSIYILIRYWVVLSVCLSICSFVIETTFPFSIFKTKHIFGILMTLRK